MLKSKPLTKKNGMPGMPVGSLVLLNVLNAKSRMRKGREMYELDR